MANGGNTRRRRRLPPLFCSSPPNPSPPFPFSITLFNRHHNSNSNNNNKNNKLALSHHQLLQTTTGSPAHLSLSHSSFVRSSTSSHSASTHATSLSQPTVLTFLAFCDTNIPLSVEANRYTLLHSYSYYNYLQWHSVRTAEGLTTSPTKTTRLTPRTIPAWFTTLSTPSVAQSHVHLPQSLLLLPTPLQPQPRQPVHRPQPRRRHPQKSPQRDLSIQLCRMWSKPP